MSAPQGSVTGEFIGSGVSSSYSNAGNSGGTTITAGGIINISKGIDVSVTAQGSGSAGSGGAVTIHSTGGDVIVGDIINLSGSALSGTVSKPGAITLQTDKLQGTLTLALINSSKSSTLGYGPSYQGRWDASGDITLIGDEVNLNAPGLSQGLTGYLFGVKYDTANYAGGPEAWGTGANLTIKPATLTQAVHLGGTDSGSSSVLDLTTAEIASLYPGFNSITIGSNTYNGAITVDSAGATFYDALTLLAPGSNASITLDGTLKGFWTNRASLTLVTGGTFVNNTGANALQPAYGTRYLVYAPSAGSVVSGGLAPSFTQTGISYPTPPNPANTGNGFLYTQ